MSKESVRSKGSAQEPLLEIKDLNVCFTSEGKQIPAVRGVSLAVYPGQTVAIVGESGSGKSTTAHAIINLLPGSGEVTSGSILFDGEDLATASAKDVVAVRGTGIGLVPQDPMSNLNPVWKIGFQIRETLEANGIAKGKAAHQRSIELLEEAGMSDAERRMNQYPHEFSGGMRQRALIAIGLSCRPKLLIADEPTSALDASVQAQVLDIIDELVKHKGMGLILISHDLNLVSSYCDRILVMRRGEVVEACAAGELANARHPYTQALIAAIPRIDETREELPVIARGEAPA